MNILKNKLEREPFLIAVHRGANGANVIDNTSLSVNLAIRMGADIVEVDVVRSTDGVLYAFHSGEEKKRFNADIDILKLSSSEIETLEYYNVLTEKSGRKVEKLEFVLKNIKGEIIINLDRAWNYFNDVFALVKKLGMEDIVVMKSPPSEEILNFLITSDIKLMYMPIIKNCDEINKFMRDDINLVAAEIIFTSSDDEIISKEYIKKLKDNDILIWFNSINLGTRHILSADYTDDNSLENENIGWEKMIELGVDIIQTDWPVFLNEYRETIKCNQKEDLQ